MCDILFQGKFCIFIPCRTSCHGVYLYNLTFFCLYIGVQYMAFISATQSKRSSGCICQLLGNIHFYKGCELEKSAAIPEWRKLESNQNLPKFSKVAVICCDLKSSNLVLFLYDNASLGLGTQCLLTKKQILEIKFNPD